MNPFVLHIGQPVKIVVAKPDRIIVAEQAQDKLKIANAKEDTKASEDAQNELNALLLFKYDMGGFQRM